MANNCLLFAESLPLKTKEEKKWIKEKLEGKNKKKYIGSFDYDLSDDEVVFYSEGDGDLEVLTKLVQKFLRKFRSKEVWSIQWSWTCSSPRVKNFGGGAAVVSAKKIEQLETNLWVKEVSKKMLAEAQNAKGHD